jgi:hypothetical protein
MTSPAPQKNKNSTNSVFGAAAENASQTAPEPFERVAPDEERFMQKIVEDHRAVVQKALAESVERSTDAIIKQTVRLHREALTWNFQQAVDFQQAVNQEILAPGKVAGHSNAHGVLMNHFDAPHVNQMTRRQLISDRFSSVPRMTAHSSPTDFRPGGNSVSRLTAQARASKASRTSPAYDVSNGGKASKSNQEALPSLPSRQSFQPMAMMMSQTLSYRRQRKDTQETPSKGIFVDEAEEKQRLRSQIAEEEYDVSNYYWESGSRDEERERKIG